jgi:ABC-type sugar transport system permease subunit
VASAHRDPYAPRVDRHVAVRRSVTGVAILFVAAVALFARMHAVDVLPVDFDEDDYLRAGQQYATGIQNGDLGVFTRENYRPEHPPLAKIVAGIAIAPLPPEPEIPDRPTTAGPADDLPEPLLTAARTANALFGVAAAVVLAIVSPLGGLFLAVHTWTIKYSSQVMLESVPAFFALLSVVLAMFAWRSPGRGRRRALLVGAAIAFGLACAGKYLYGVAGLAIVVDWLWRTAEDARDRDGSRSATGVARWAAPAIGWLALGFVAFLVADPYLWPDPIGRLASSIAYHGGYATSEAVQETGWPMWQPIVWLMGSVPWNDPGTFIVTIDIVITALAAVGLRRTWREHRVFALWLGLGLAFLILWPTKWPQYVLVISAPLSLAAAHGTRAALEPLRAWVDRRRRGPDRDGVMASPRRGVRGSVRDLRRASPWLVPGLIGFAILALIPIAYEAMMAVTDLRLKNLRDGLQGGVLREAGGGLTGQIPAVPFDINGASNHVQYVGTDLINGFQQGFWFGQNTTAAVITFSILWMVTSVFFQAVLGIAVALVLERPGVRFANAWRVLFILPWAIPEAVGAVAWQDILHPQQGLLAQLTGGEVAWYASPELSLGVLLLAATWMGWPLWMLVATAGLRTIPRSVHDAAAIEGAGRWRTFASITLPLLLPLLGAAFVVRGVAAFNQFYLFYVLNADFQTTTLATLSFNLFNSSSGPGLFSVSAAINIVTVIGLAFIVAWFLRWRSRAERVALT